VRPRIAKRGSEPCAPKGVQAVQIGEVIAGDPTFRVFRELPDGRGPRDGAIDPIASTRHAGMELAAAPTASGRTPRQDREDEHRAARAAMDFRRFRSGAPGACGLQRVPSSVLSSELECGACRSRRRSLGDRRGSRTTANVGIAGNDLTDLDGLHAFGAHARCHASHARTARRREDHQKVCGSRISARRHVRSRRRRPSHDHRSNDMFARRPTEADPGLGNVDSAQEEAGRGSRGSGAQPTTLGHLVGVAGETNRVMSVAAWSSESTAARPRRDRVTIEAIADARPGASSVPFL